jgi:hypothetical protein
MREDQPVLIAELHVDDLALEAGGDHRRAVALIEAIAEAAEDANAALSFRFRRLFAEQAARGGAGNVLRRLEARGHEVGTHAHGRGLGRAARAVSACGVANQGVTPGMVQAGSQLGRMWRALSRLGFAWVTDHPPHRAWAYAGLLPWQPGQGFEPWSPASGPVMLETTADPFAWGLLHREGDRVLHQHRLGPEHFDRLEGLLARHRCALPAGVRPFFSFALHEHNLCAPGSLRPLPAALEAFSAFLTRHEVRSAGAVAASMPSPAALVQASPQHRAQRFARTIRVRSRPLRQRLVGRPADDPGAFAVRAGARTLHAAWHGPARPRGVLLLSHAGLQGGTHSMLRPFGVDHGALTGHGLAVVAFDRSGTGRSPAPVSLGPGQGQHVQDFRAVIRAVRSRLEPGVPLGVLSFSSGILPPLRAEEPFDFLIDGEAPADRWTLRPPHGARAPRDSGLWDRSTDDDRAWEGLEPAGLLGALRCPYHRLQAEVDHVHGRLIVHAQRMFEAARAAGLPSVRFNGAAQPQLLPGSLHAHGPRIQGWILEAFEGL